MQDIYSYLCPGTQIPDEPQFITIAIQMIDLKKSIWRKIDKHSFNIHMISMMWIIIWIIMLKIYNSIYFVSSKYSSTSELQKVVFFNLDYIKEFLFSHIFVIFISIALIPPVIFFCFTYISSIIVEREDEIIRKEELNAFLKEHQKKQPQKLPKNQKKVKKKNKRKPSKKYNKSL